MDAYLSQQAALASILSLNAVPFSTLAADLRSEKSNNSAARLLSDQSNDIDGNRLL